MEDNRWKEIIRQLRRSGGLASSSPYPYFMDDDLVYYLDPVDARRWLCIPTALEKNIFAMAHDEQHHADLVSWFTTCEMTMTVH